MKHTSKNIEIFVLDFLKKKRKVFIIILTLNQLRTTDCSGKPHFSEKYTPAKKITLLENDKIITNDSDIAEVMNEFFTNIVDQLEIEGFLTKHVDYNFEIDHIANIIAKFKEHPVYLKLRITL